jgi:hypothetical protein
VILTPPRFGSTEWEFAALGEVSATLVRSCWASRFWAGFGLEGRRGRLVGLAIAVIVLGVALAVGAGLAALNLPLVWVAARGSGVAELKLVGVKTVVLLGLYSLWCLVFGWRAIRV